jgi:hypothetical protein
MVFSGAIVTVGRLQNRCNNMEHLHCLSIVDITYSHFKAEGCASPGIHMTLGSALLR